MVIRVRNTGGGIRSSRNATSRFARDVNRFAEKFGVDVDEVVQYAAVEIWRATIAATPVDTGAARASWRLSQDTVNLSVSGPGQSPPTPTLQGAKNGRPVSYFISNNINYIPFLERGSSRQAPRGMLARSVRRFETFLREGARQI